MRYILILMIGGLCFLYGIPSLEKCQKDLKECLVGVSYYTDNYDPKKAQKFKAIIDEKYSHILEQIGSAQQAVFGYYFHSYLEKSRLPKGFSSPSNTTKLERDKNFIITLNPKPKIFQVIPGEGFLAQWPYYMCDSLSTQDFCQLIFIEKKGFDDKYADGDFLPSAYYIYDGLYTYSTIGNSSKTIPKYRNATKETEQINLFEQDARQKTEKYFQKYENGTKVIAF